MPDQTVQLTNASFACQNRRGASDWRRPPGGVAALLASALLAGCASAPQRSGGMSGVPINAESGCHAPQPDLRAAYNRTYTVRGRSYTPLHSAQGYDEQGVASWYGWESGSTTSMGTRFAPREFTAASRVLPLPTCVQVTNLDNGRSALVLVNDRGPFADGRILDLSYGAATALGVARTGTAPIRIVALPGGANAPLQIAGATKPLPAEQVAAGRSSNGQAARPTSAMEAANVSAPQQFGQSSGSATTGPNAAPESQPLVAASVPQTVPESAPMVVEPLAPLRSASRMASFTPASGASSQGNAGPPQVSLTPTGGGLGAARPWGRSASSLPALSDASSIPAQQVAQNDLPQPALQRAATSNSAPIATGGSLATMAPTLAGSPQSFVQTGAFTLEANARTEQARLNAAGIQDVLIVPGYLRGQTFYRVQIGPLVGASPNQELQRKLQALGLMQYSVVQQ